MLIVGKTGEKYLCSLSIHELMSLFPKIHRPPVASLREGEEYDIKEWAESVENALRVSAWIDQDFDSIKYKLEELRGLCKR